MHRSKLHYRHSLLLLFDLKKTAAEAHQTLVEAYGDEAPSQTTCKCWFQRFKAGDFDLENKGRGKPPKKFEDADLQELLDQNTTQTEKELARALGVDQATISRRLHAMTNKEGNA